MGAASLQKNSVLLVFSGRALHSSLTPIAMACAECGAQSMQFDVVASWIYDRLFGLEAHVRLERDLVENGRLEVDGPVAKGIENYEGKDEKEAVRGHRCALQNILFWKFLVRWGLSEVAVCSDLCVCLLMSTLQGDAELNGGPLWHLWLVQRFHNVLQKHKNQFAGSGW